MAQRRWGRRWSVGTGRWLFYRVPGTGHEVPIASLHKGEHVSPVTVDELTQTIVDLLNARKIELGSDWQQNPRHRHTRHRRELSVPDRHLLRIARDSLRMPEPMLGVMGGPSKEEARRIIKALTGREPREEEENPAGQLWGPGGVGVGKITDEDGKVYYLAVPVETTVGWDYPTLRGMFPQSFDPERIALLEARLGYEHSGQHGYRLFKVRVAGKWSRPLPLRTVLTSFPGIA